MKTPLLTCELFLDQNLNHSEVAFCSKITTDDTAITNAVDVYRNPR